MGIAHVQYELAALKLGAVTNAFYLQVLRKAIGHAHHHVVYQGAGQAVQRAVTLFIAGALHKKHAIFLFNLHIGRDLLTKSALGALHGHGVAVIDRDCHSARNAYRKFSDS